MPSIDDFVPPRKGDGLIVFVRSKSCPVTFRPLGSLHEYHSVYDAVLKRNRVPAPNDEKKDIRARWLVNGMGIDGVIRVYDLGSTTIEAIQNVRRTVLKLGLNPDIYVTISAKGTGMDTSYHAEPAKVPADAPTGAVDPSKLRTLVDFERMIVVDPTTTEGGLTGAAADAAFAWADAK